MSSENGIPMEGERQTWEQVDANNHPHLAARLSEKDQRIAELEAECERLNIEIKRIRKTAGNMFDSGVAFSVFNRFDGGIHRPFNKEEALKHNGLGE